MLVDTLSAAELQPSAIEHLRLDFGYLYFILHSKNLRIKGSKKMSSSWLYYYFNNYFGF